MLFVKNPRRNDLALTTKNVFLRICNQLQSTGMSFSLRHEHLFKAQHACFEF
ncbi:MAG TPA: hypothetical protein VFR58_05330 [Flavisolibacter sp.]|nr:hypothetical protein [Flavisolibacter sp.]